MATSLTKRHISVSDQLNLRNDRTLDLRPNAATNIDPLPSGVPVKFADHLFSLLVKDQINHLLNLPKIKELKYTDENAARALTSEITEIIKRIVAQHTKENYKVVIQVLTYPKQDEQNILIMNRCLWNYRTDDVLSIETETDTFKFLIIIHGLIA